MKKIAKKISAVLLATFILSACANQDEAPNIESEVTTEPDQSTTDNSNAETEAVQNTGTPALPTTPDPTEVLVQDLMNETQPTETGTLDDLPQDLPEATDSPEYSQATTPESPQDCEAIQDAELKSICYHAAGYSDNSPSVEEDAL